MTLLLSALFVAPQALAQTGTGLRGEYRRGTASYVRIDPQINFDWGNEPLAPGLPTDDVQVSWTGMVQAPVTGSYTFHTQTDDSVRLSIDGVTVINDPNEHSATWNQSSAIPLIGGRKYLVRMDYAEVRGLAVARLCWSYPGQERQVIPQSRLFPTTTAQEIPNAPTDLTATGVWSNSCCNGQPMAHIALTWKAAPAGFAAKSFNVYRNGTLAQSGLTVPEWSDMGVPSGQTNSYQVTAVGASGMESSKSAAASATAPYPPAGSGFVAPTNLCVFGQWNSVTKTPTDILTWDAVTGATGYNIYQYDRVVARNVTATSFAIPASMFVPGITYTVTAVDRSGNETLPSNTAGAQGMPDPAVTPKWTPNPPDQCRSLAAKTEWNLGKPRVRLSWAGGGNAYTFNVYRNGVPVARGVWGQTWLDNDVRQGDKPTYTVRGENVPWRTAVEGPVSLPVSTTVVAAPVVIAGTKVTVTRTVVNDDSAIVYFDPVVGAADYRVYRAGTMGTYKYSGGGLSVEMNGLVPGEAATLVVEAVDKLGPFQKMDGMAGPGTNHADGMMSMAVNGQGDPSNVPVVLATSVPVVVTCKARTLTGSQTFFDTFRDSTAFAPASVPPVLLAANEGMVSAIENNRWLIYNIKGDRLSTRAFIMGNHFMDTVYDGGTPGTGQPLHVTDASLVMQPKATADISQNKVLHVTFEVDAHFSSRRWCDVMITGATDPLMNTGLINGNQSPTVSGNAFRWQILSDVHTAEIFRGRDALGKVIALPLFDQANGVGPDSFGPPSRKYQNWTDTPIFNGTPQDLDRRHRFDLYLSQNRFRVVEEGKVVKDKSFPTGVTLPFSRVSVYFVHQVYHTSNERAEELRYGGANPYWLNHRPYADERHWDNMGFEVLSSFPN